MQQALIYAGCCSLPYNVLSKVVQTSALSVAQSVHSQRVRQSLASACFCNSLARYKMTKDLGSGAFSVVKLAEDKVSKEMVAIKCVDR